MNLRLERCAYPDSLSRAMEESALGVLVPGAAESGELLQNRSTIDSVSKKSVPRLRKKRAAQKATKNHSGNTLSALSRKSLAYKEVSERISFLGSGIHFESLKVVEDRHISAAIQKKRKSNAKRKSRRKKTIGKYGFKPVKALPPPGPATYNIPSGLGVGLSKYSGIFSKSKPKEEIDWVMYYASQTPGANAYPRPPLPKIGGGRFNESKPKSEIEWVICRAKDLPGPANYRPAPLPLPKGGRISTAKVKSEIDWIRYFAKDTPGSNHYPAPKLPNPGGGRFNSGNGKSEIEWTIYFNKGTPGPATYGMMPNPKIGGGRFNESKPKTNLEWVTYFASQTPGPDVYNIAAHPGGDYVHPHPRPSTSPAMLKTLTRRAKSPSQEMLRQTIQQKLYSPLDRRDK